MTDKITPAMRRKARALALQAIYQWQLSAEVPEQICAHFLIEHQNRRVDFDYFKELVHQIPKFVDELNAYLLPILDRSLDEINPVELAILRSATNELRYRLDVPYRVVINEALELAKTYGAAEGFKYVNGVLDRIARQLRTIEAGK